VNYSILGQNLHAVADRAKAYFAAEYGAKHFSCESPVEHDLPLRPTWQAELAGGYYLCVEVRESPFSNTLYEFVSKCAANALPIRLWVVVPEGAAAPSFGTELKQARDLGVGVVQISDDGVAHVFHRPVALSLFALKKTDFNEVPKSQRDEVKTAESIFLDGSPDQGCQAICQALEQVTRKFAERTYEKGLWKQDQASSALDAAFFQTGPWSKVLEALESRIDTALVRAKSSMFHKNSIVRARGYTDWRNSVSHKPNSFKKRLARDAKLRTMFESTRDLLVEWYGIAKPFKVLG
jgi:hypothetical protein